ncbi:triphosphoribosyl-dephospho-CoA synthase [Azospirillum melinis]|uniref:triphosphoribosyl-dephospho-CoA synthase n=1 Tax=Azospirillum melinis TaxID=328839 RepID=UPI001FED085D|nr:triphosphoribosyl-dephospho-CoA synthase [Azospirillum melinis]MBP2305288.1 triphosphoribosyl-dephospho-CoA synthase [Azospirillum melinis]
MSALLPTPIYDCRSLVEEAVFTACRLELMALKPGNVHIHADGHGMSVAQFLDSAAAIAPILATPGRRVGEAILHAVAATRDVAGCNTNLGIVLLLAPLATAALCRDKGEPLRLRLARVLDGLSVADAADAFAAIRLALPAGLGEAQQHDVAAAPRVDLRAAMAAAADRDLIARQYATAFADVFTFGVARGRSALRRGASPAEAASAIHLGFMALHPDTHIARKHGAAVAERVRAQAFRLERRLSIGSAFGGNSGTARRLLAFDRALKRRGLNPGTSADLTVACLFVLRLAGDLPAGPWPPDDCRRNLIEPTIARDAQCLRSTRLWSAKLWWATATRSLTSISSSVRAAAPPRPPSARP